MFWTKPLQSACAMGFVLISGARRRGRRRQVSAETSMVGCSSVSSAGTCGAKCGMLDCLRGDLNGKKQQHSVDSKVSSSWREQFGFVYGRS